MTSRRLLKAAEAIREVVSMAILADLKDPRIHDVTVTYVEVSPDLRQAKVHVSVMGDESKQNLSLRGLRSAAGYLQSCVNTRIDTRHTPRLSFVLDQGIKKSFEISRILKEVLPDQSAGDAKAGDVAEAASREIPHAVDRETPLRGDGVGPRSPAGLPASTEITTPDTDRPERS